MMVETVYYYYYKCSRQREREREKEERVRKEMRGIKENMVLHVNKLFFNFKTFQKK